MKNKDENNKQRFSKGALPMYTWEHPVGVGVGGQEKYSNKNCLLRFVMQIKVSAFYVGNSC